jgi:hypothetical protein
MEWELRNAALDDVRQQDVVRLATQSARNARHPMVADMIENGELDMAEAIRNQPIGRPEQPTRSRRPDSGFAAPEPAPVVGVALPVDGSYTAPDCHFADFVRAKSRFTRLATGTRAGTSGAAESPDNS